jgi:alpha-tubulin suppressor-like RCC1 family protein
MTQILSRTGNKRQRFTIWDIAEAYQTGDMVAKDNKVWVANAIIPANTPFKEGTSGKTWTMVVRGFNSPPEIKLPWSGSIFARVFSCGNQIYRAGSGVTNRLNGGITDSTGPGSSLELPCIDPPESWVKIGATVSNFYGLGNDGALYVMGYDGYGQLGDGGGTTFQAHITKNTHPTLYGTGIQVLDFWSMENDFDADAFKTNILVCVNDNGTIKNYAFGWNSNGTLGIGNATTQTTPVEITVLRNKRIKTISSYPNIMMVVTEGGELWGAGYNPHGTLGIGNATSPIQTMTQAKINNTTTVSMAVDVKIAYRSGTGITSYVLLADGRVLASGTGNGGALGDGNTADHQSNYFQPVLTYPGNVPLTGITKIGASYTTLMALNGTTNQLYACGHNWDGVWGNGQGGNVTEGFAGIKQRNIKDFWLTMSHDGNMSVFFLDTNNVLRASGANTDFQLGVLYNAQSPVVSVAQRVPLPEGEYPVTIVRTGTTTGSPFVGHTCLTNKNRIFMWGYAFESPLQDMAQIRWPLLVNDFYSSNQR